MTQFAADLDGRKYKAQVDADIAHAKEIGVRGTPNFFINGKKLTGAQPFAKFKVKIDEVLKGKGTKAVPTKLVAPPKVEKAQAPKKLQPKINPLAIKKPANKVTPELLKALKNIKAKGKNKGKVSIPAGKSASKGSAQALVTIIEFSDFQCPFCKRVTGSLEKIHKTYGDKVRVVFKHNPLPFHKDAPLASQAAYAAQQQGKFWEMHDKIFENMRALKRPELDKYAAAIGLDMAKFKADIDSDAAKAQVKADQALAAKLQARGTPHFFVNGKRLPGALPFDRFKTVIDAELKETAALVKGGKSIADAYQARVNANYEAPKPRKPRGGAAADDKTVYNIQPGNSYGKGGAEPLVTIIEFSEFQCPFCSRVLPTMKKIHETYGDKVRVVFKHNPLPFHKDATPASKAALAAGEQGKFWEMHDLLFANQRKLKEANLMSYAEQLGLNMAKFKTDMGNAKFDKMIKADQALAARFGARGTPGFFVNGRNLRGAQPFAKFKTLIDAELKKAEALIAKGTARKDVYKVATAKGKKKSGSS
jgi:protein-disulfide isomerase